MYEASSDFDEIQLTIIATITSFHRTTSYA